MSDKTQALLSPGTSVRIRKHRRQVGSEFATFLDFFWREDEPWVVLRLPSGRRTAVPASWTDLPTDCFAQPTRSSGDPSLGPPGTGPILPEACTGPEATPSDKNPRSQPGTESHLVGTLGTRPPALRSLLLLHGPQGSRSTPVPDRRWRHDARQLRHPKIRPEHLRRQAIVYIRQSSPHQVRGPSREYCPPVCPGRAGQDSGLAGQVGPDDRRRSRTFGHQRRPSPGFQEAAGGDRSRPGRRRVGPGSIAIGAVVADWHRLVEICVVTQTLLADETAVYDPRDPNDRLLLGVKGTISEAELFTLRCRLHEGRWNKARRGELARSLPVGYVRTESGDVVKDPDRQVQARLEYIFRLFAQHKVARQVLVQLVQEKLQDPRQSLGWAAARYGDLEGAGLQRPDPHPAQSHLRRRLCLRAEGVRLVRPLADQRQGQGPPASPGRVAGVPARRLPGLHHLGAVRAEPRDPALQWLSPREPRERRAKVGPCCRESPTAGAAVRRMSVLYYSTKEKRAPGYGCFHRIQPPRRLDLSVLQLGGRRRGGHEIVPERRCRRPRSRSPCTPWTSGRPITRRPASNGTSNCNVPITRSNWHGVATKRRTREPPGGGRIGNALGRSPAPTGTTPARKRRNERRQEQPLSEADRRRIRELSSDLERVWHAKTTSMEDRKTLLRFLIKRVHLDGVTEAGKIRIDVEWHTGAHTKLTIDRPLVGVWAPKTPTAAVERIRELLPEHDYAAIAVEAERRRDSAQPRGWRMTINLWAMWPGRGVGLVERASTASGASLSIELVSYEGGYLSPRTRRSLVSFASYIPSWSASSVPKTAQTSSR